jgi:hypothetical protein
VLETIRRIVPHRINHLQKRRADRPAD